jgi:glutamyl-tRNA reductase
MSNPWNLQLTLVGTNHKRASIDIRERLWCRPEVLPARLESLVEGAISEAVILSTCNRTEIYALSSPDSKVAEYLKKALAEWSGIAQADLERYLYVLTSEEAVHHLIRVAAGLDSLAVPEQQIQEQVTQAVRVANRLGTGGRFLSELFRRADNAGSKIRKQSGFAENISISSAVTTLLRQLSGERKFRSILLVGAGKMISLAAEDLSGLTEAEVWVANRTQEKARALAERVGGRAINMSDIPEALGRADVVLICTSSDDYVIRTEELQRAASGRGSKELVVIDVAVPRNVEPEAKNIVGLRLYDIDDLAPLGQDLSTHLQHQLIDAERLVAEETRDFYAHLRGYEANDLLKDLRKVAEDIREEELSRALRKLGDVPTREKTILDLLTRRIVNKLLYEPTLRLKTHATNGDGETYEAMIRELFDIGRPNEK